MECMYTLPHIAIADELLESMEPVTLKKMGNALAII